MDSGHRSRVKFLFNPPNINPMKSLMNWQSVLFIAVVAVVATHLYARYQDNQKAQQLAAANGAAGAE